MKLEDIHLMILTPAGGNRVNTQYLLSFAQTINLLASKGVKITPFVVPTGSLLVAERNRLMQMFWESKCTHVLCIDADLGWPADAVIKLLEADKEFVGGVYPARTGPEENYFNFRPDVEEDGKIKVENKLLKMLYIPAGFMLIKREAIQKMRDKFPELYYEPKDSMNKEIATFMLFNTEIYEGEFWGEDYTFCRKAREAGVDIWVDPLIQFDHDGKVGALIQCLTNKKPEEQSTINNIQD